MERKTDISHRAEGRQQIEELEDEPDFVAPYTRQIVVSPLSIFNVISLERPLCAFRRTA
jgi:hypothetical protein